MDSTLVVTFAKAGFCRIGEAQNPGPLSYRRSLDSRLEDIPLVEPRTQALQNKIWKWFVDWVSSQLSPPAAASVLESPILIALMIKEFGNHLFETGKSLYLLRHLVVFVQKEFLGARMYLSCCWDLIAKWETLEPPIHRTPLPSVILRAMVVVALHWKWPRFAATLVLGFFGILRPGEILRARRRELLLPEDLCFEAGLQIFLRIDEPKTKRRSRGKTQHAVVEDPLVVPFLAAVFGRVRRDEFIYPISPSSFRRRWDIILGHLKIPGRLKLTPGSLRGGGACHFYREHQDLGRLMWKMRLRQQQTLENYLQEVGAYTALNVRSSCLLSSLTLLCKFFRAPRRPSSRP